MGVVYKAYDPDIKQFVAIKTINKELLNLGEKESHMMLERFKNEAIAGRRLKHSNIVAIYEYGRDQDVWYIVMEFVQGRPLKDYIAQGHDFGLGEIVEIMRQLLDALGYAHEHGVVHRDIKPANIMVMEGGQIQVTDFGIAKIDTSSVTKTGAVLGTPSYMAPEQCLGQRIDARTDIFSAGVILYQLLTGEKPFGGDGDSPMSTMHKVLNVAPIDPSYLNVHVPADFDDIVQRAMAKRPDERFQSARELKEALASVYQDLRHENGSGTPANEGTLSVTDATLGAPDALRPPPARVPAAALPKTGKNRIGIAIVGLTAVMGTAIGWKLLHPHPEPGETPPSDRPSSAVAPPAVDRSRLDALLGSFSCARLEANIDDLNKITLKGHIKPDDLSQLQRLAADVPGVTGVISQVETLMWPYCEVFELLAPYKRSSGSQGQDALIGPQQRTPRYTEGDNLVLALTAPSYDAYLYIDYYQLDGGVIHLLPQTPEQIKRYRAQERITIGEPKAGEKQWQVQPPFGREMIVVVASREPLFDALRPEVEPAKDYLSALREALPRSDKDGVTADYFYITTAAATASAD